MLFASYNIQFGRGKDQRFDLPRIAAELQGADVIALQEVERYWQRSGNVDQVAELVGLLGDYHWVYGAGVDLHVDGEAAGSRRPRRRQFGNALLSRQPILSSRHHLLPKYASTGPMSLQRSAIEAVINTGAGAMRVYSVHLTHLSAATRIPQVETLLRIHQQAGVEGAAITGANLGPDWMPEGLPAALPRQALFMGDFNFQPDSREYEKFTGPLSPYGGRVTNPEGFVDAWAAAGHDLHSGVSADIKGRPVRLDYCFLSTVLEDRIREARIDSQAQGSDHQPIWLNLDV